MFDFIKKIFQVVWTSISGFLSRLIWGSPRSEDKKPSEQRRNEGPEPKVLPKNPENENKVTQKVTAQTITPPSKVAVPQDRPATERQVAPFATPQVAPFATTPQAVEVKPPSTTLEAQLQEIQKENEEEQQIQSDLKTGTLEKQMIALKQLAEQFARVPGKRNNLLSYFKTWFLNPARHDDNQLSASVFTDMFQSANSDDREWLLRKVLQPSFESIYQSQRYAIQVFTKVFSVASPQEQAWLLRAFMPVLQRSSYVKQEAVTAFGNVCDLITSENTEILESSFLSTLVGYFGSILSDRKIEPDAVKAAVQVLPKVYRIADSTRQEELFKALMLRLFAVSGTTVVAAAKAFGDMLKLNLINFSDLSNFLKELKKGSNQKIWDMNRITCVAGFIEVCIVIPSEDHRVYVLRDFFHILCMDEAILKYSIKAFILPEGRTALLKAFILWLSESNLGENFDYEPFIKILTNNGVEPETIRSEILAWSKDHPDSWLANKNLLKQFFSKSSIENKESAEDQESTIKSRGEGPGAGEPEPGVEANKTNKP